MPKFRASSFGSCAGRSLNSDQWSSHLPPLRCLYFKYGLSPPSGHFYRVAKVYACECQCFIAKGPLKNVLACGVCYNGNRSNLSWSADDDEPKSPRKKGGPQKRRAAGGVFRDDNGRVISREEAKRIRKYVIFHLLLQDGNRICIEPEFRLRSGILKDFALFLILLSSRQAWLVNFLPHRQFDLSGEGGFFVRAILFFHSKYLRAEVYLILILRSWIKLVAKDCTDMQEKNKSWLCKEDATFTQAATWQSSTGGKFFHYHMPLGGAEASLLYCKAVSFPIFLIDWNLLGPCGSLFLLLVWKKGILSMLLQMKAGKAVECITELNYSELPSCLARY